MAEMNYQVAIIGGGPAGYVAAIRAAQLGGKVVLVTGYSDQAMPNVDAILDYMGLKVVDGLVVEQNKDNYYRSPYYILPEVSPGTYTSGIYNKM